MRTRTLQLNYDSANDTLHITLGQKSQAAARQPHKRFPTVTLRHDLTKHKPCGLTVRSFKRSWMSSTRRLLALQALVCEHLPVRSHTLPRSIRRAIEHDAFMQHIHRFDTDVRQRNWPYLLWIESR